MARTRCLFPVELSVDSIQVAGDIFSSVQSLMTDVKCCVSCIVEKHLAVGTSEYFVFLGLDGLFCFCSEGSAELLCPPLCE